MTLARSDEDSENNDDGSLIITIMMCHGSSAPMIRMRLMRVVIMELVMMVMVMVVMVMMVAHGMAPLM